MIPRRSLLSLALAALALAPGARAAGPAERQLARRLELWARAAAGTRLLVARYAGARQSALLQEPLTTTGTLVARAPDLLLLRDDARDGSTTRLTRDRLEIRPNDPALPALAVPQAPAITWLFEHMLALLAVVEGAEDPSAALLADARASVPRGAGQLLDLSPRRDHPARWKIRDLVVHLDPHTGDVEQMDLLESSGDRMTLQLSQRRRDPPAAELAALLSP